MAFCVDCETVGISLICGTTRSAIVLIAVSINQDLMESRKRMLAVCAAIAANAFRWHNKNEKLLELFLAVWPEYVLI